MIKKVWSPNRGILKGKTIFLSASVPNPARNPKFLEGGDDSMDEMLRVQLLDTRINDAVRSVVMSVLEEGGRIAHGGHPSITQTIMEQAQLFDEIDGDPPILTYQSRMFTDNKEYEPPPGLLEMEESGHTIINRVSHKEEDLEKARKLLPKMTDKEFDELIFRQSAPQAPQGLKIALLMLRVIMLGESKPIAGVSMGGMEGIEVEADMFHLILSRKKTLPYYAFPSTLGAAAQLGRTDILVVDGEPHGGPELATVKEDLWERRD
ncbi:MAG: hypothetical protein KDK36_03130, partial [Leptospiraceae bacterium]|nr:hypothetical protein [Leptospiraceae bacterium]